MIHAGLTGVISALPDAAPWGGLALFITAGVLGWIRFRNRQVFEYSDLLKQAAEERIRILKENADLRRELKEGRDREGKLYDLAERRRRVITAHNWPDPAPGPLPTQEDV
jgi:hypothetical protein